MCRLVHHPAEPGQVVRMGQTEPSQQQGRGGDSHETGPSHAVGVHLRRHVSQRRSLTRGGRIHARPWPCRCNIEPFRQLVRCLAGDNQPLPRPIRPRSRTVHKLGIRRSAIWVPRWEARGYENAAALHGCSRVRTRHGSLLCARRRRDEFQRCGGVDPRDRTTWPGLDRGRRWSRRFEPPRV
jgi:hypothetical protein